MIKNLLDVIYNQGILRFPLVALVAVLTIVGLLSLSIPSFKLDASSDALVLEGDTSLDYYREIYKRYGSNEQLLVVYQPEQSLFSDESLNTIQKMKDALSRVKGVESVTTLLDVPLLYATGASLSDIAEVPYLMDKGVDREKAEQEFRTSPIYKELLASADGKTTILQVVLTWDEQYQVLVKARDVLREKKRNGTLMASEKDELKVAEKAFRDYATAAVEKQQQLVSDTRLVLDQFRNENNKIYLGGVPMIAADMVAFVKSDLSTFGVGVLLFIVLLLVIIFRQLRWVVLPLLTCVLTVVALLGYLTWIDWRLTVVSSNFPALLLIITLSLTIHLAVRYRELRRNFPEAEKQSLVFETVCSMIKPCLYTSLTTIVAFVSLVISGIRPVIDFGWMMTIGIILAFLFAFLVIPVGLMLWPESKKELTNKGNSNDDELAEEKPPVTMFFSHLTEKYKGIIALIVTLLVVLSVMGVAQLKVENRFIDYFHEDTEIYQGMSVIDEELGGTIPLDIIIDAPKKEPLPGMDKSWQEDNAFENPFDDVFSDEDDEFADTKSGESSVWFNSQGLNQIEGIHHYLQSLPEVGKVLSLGTIYQVVKDLSGGTTDNIQLALVQKKVPKEVSDFLIKPYLDDEIGQTRISVRVMETSKDLHRNQLLKQLEQDISTQFNIDKDRLHFTGMLVLYNNMLQSLFTSQILTLGFVFLSIMLMFVILFRSFSLALIAIAPNLLAAGAVLGGMGWFGIPLDMMTITIAAITIGIGVDDTIHYIHRFRTEFAKDRNYLATMHRSHFSIGRAMFYTSITVILGFSVLMLSNFTPTIYFGLLTGVAMFAALMGALLLLPLLLVTLKPLGKEQ